MAQEIYHRSEWGNPTETWGNVYLNADLTNELYKRASEYENSWVTDQLLNGVGTKPSIILTPTAYEDGVLNSVKPAKTLGDNEVTNGTFDTDANWIKSSNATISNGSAHIVSDGSYQYIGQVLVLTVGKKYRVEYEIIENNSGFLKMSSSFGSNFSPIASTVGFHSFEAVAIASTFYIERQTACDIKIDNVSVKEVIDADFDFTRGSSATRVNEQGLVEDVQILSGELVQNGDFEQIGSEQIVNGGFDTDSDWTKGTGWGIADGKAYYSGTTNSDLAQSGILTSGKLYKLQYEVINSTLVNGVVKLSGTTASAQNVLSQTVGTHTLYFTADGTIPTSFNIRIVLNTSGQFELDNVSVKEVGQNWTLTQATVEGGKLLLSTSDGSYTAATQSLATIGRLYRISLDVADIVGTVSVAIGGGTDVNITTNGTHTFEITSASTTFEVKRKFGITNVSATIDNISVIEVTDDTDLPRINYTDGEGSLKLEPQSTNLITYSEDFSEWSPTNIVLTEDLVISPDGTTTADKIAGTSVTSQHRVNFTSTNVSGATTFSFFAKSAEYTSCWARIGLGNAYFDLENGVSSQGAGITSSIENYGNGWYRCIMTKASSSANEVCRINLTTSYLGTSDFLGDNTSGIYLWGGQHEQLSYATSYIPTNGSTVTRLADLCNNAGNSDLINSTEGVLYVEALLKDTGTFKTAARITATDTSTSDGLWIYFRSDNKIQSVLRVGGVDQVAIISTVQTTDEYYKVAFKYKQNDFALWVNGTEVSTDTSGNTFSADTLSKLGFVLSTSTNPFIGNVKCLAVFKEALSDTELEKLTTI